MRTGARRRLWGGSVAALAALGFVGGASAEFLPILHERFEPEPAEDLALGVRVTSSGLPAAIKTRAGVASLPEPGQPPQAREPAYAESHSQVNPTLRPDGTTSDPGRQSYHEPFRPSVAPFKRTHVYDSVNEQFELVLSEPRLRPVAMVAFASPSQDEFFADLVIDVKGEIPVRIASAGPHMTVYGAHLEPESPFGFYADRADNWFVRAPGVHGKARLVMHVGVERAAFDGRMEVSSYSALARELPRLPANVERVATEALGQVRVSRVMSPKDALAGLVTYFRGFSESKEHLEGHSGEALYRSLVASRKGVCRHRAYAFVVTALGLGIPARFVHNEAHAWVEVFGGTLWHRIDLGGAASGIDYRGEPPVGKPHVPPTDPYPWPKQNQDSSHADGLDRTAPTSGAAPGRSSGATEPTASLQEPVNQRGEPTRVTDEVARAADAPSKEDSSKVGNIAVTLADGGKVRRGHPLDVRGQLDSAGGKCGGVRVELQLLRQSKVRASAAATTDAAGRFVAQLFVPPDVEVGAYELSATSVGTKDCPRATTR